MLKLKVAAGLLVGLVSATTTQAASVSYFLDQSNRLADGINYLMVTISDERKAGVIDFTVVALQPLLDLAGENFGIHKFGFNVVGGIGAEARKVTELPTGWGARNGGRMSGFGIYDITLKGSGRDKNSDSGGKGSSKGSSKSSSKGAGKHDIEDDIKGNNPQNPLTFSIAGVSFDTVMSYIDLSTGHSPEGFSFFSAHVIGLNLGDCGTDTGKTGAFSASGGGGSCITSAYFGGTSVVPAPPAVWLLGTAVGWLVVRRLRGSRVARAA